MTDAISSQNINSVRLFQANTAFKHTQKKPEAPQQDNYQEEVKITDEPKKMFADHNIDEIKEYAKSVGTENLSNDDIKYGLYFGRSVIIDYSV